MNRTAFKTGYSRDKAMVPMSEISTHKDNDVNIAYNILGVQSIQTTNIPNITDFSSYISVNQYIVLLGQTKISQNGLYKQTGASSATKQILTDDWFFVDILSSTVAKCVYTHKSGIFSEVKYNSVNIEKEVETTGAEAKDIFDLPGPMGRPLMIDLTVFGIYSDHTQNFTGMYKRGYYNTDGTTYVDLGLFNNSIKKTSGFLTPTLNFLNTPPRYTLTSTAGSPTIKWTIKATLTF